MRRRRLITPLALIIVSKLYVMDADGKNRRALAEGFDRSPTGLLWASDGSGVYFGSEDRGSDNLYFAALKGGTPQAVTRGVQQLQVTSITKSGVAAGVLSSPTEPGDVVVFNLKSPAPKKLTDVNGDLLEGRKLGAVEEIWYDSVGNKKVQGWVVKPPDFDPAKKYPLILAGRSQ
jgi:dipeptidyl aminopeptidase/acylaminoacyl peptidase